MVGKLMILKEALGQGHYWITFIFLAALAVIFIGMARIFISMTYGRVSIEENIPQGSRQGKFFWRTLVPGVFFVLAVWMGMYFPSWFSSALEAAAKGLRGV